MSYPLTVEGAEQFFPQQDRQKAAKDLEPLIKNVKQRLYRAHKKAREALASWDSKSGHHHLCDLLDYERWAERQQLIARELAGLETHQRDLAAEFIIQNVSRDSSPADQGISEGRKTA